MKNKMLLSIMLMAAGCAVASEQPQAKQAEQTPTEQADNGSEFNINFARLGIDCNAKLKFNSRYKALCKGILGLAGLGLAVKYAPKYVPRLITPNTVRAGIVGSASLYVLKAYKNSSWSDLLESTKTWIKNAFKPQEPTERDTQTEV